MASGKKRMPDGFDFSKPVPDKPIRFPTPTRGLRGLSASDPRLGIFTEPLKFYPIIKIKSTILMSYTAFQK
jgi:hypothetical protein